MSASEGSATPKILVVGLGSIAKRHIRVLRKLGHDQIVLLRRPSSARNSLGLPEARSWEAVSRFAPEIAVITNPTTDHVATALECARRGMHLFIEKPLAMNAHGVGRLVRLVRRRRLTCQIGCHLRFDPLLQFVKDSVRKDGGYFYAKAVCSSNLVDWRSVDYRLTTSAKRKLGGGVILDLIHEPDYLQWLFGPALEVTGTAGRISDLEIDTEDFAEMHIRHGAGRESHVSIDYFGSVPERSLILMGHRRMLRADLIGRTIVVLDGRRRRTRSFPLKGPDDVYEKQLRHFFRVISGKARPVNDLDEHWRCLRPVLDFRGRALASRGRRGS